MKPVIERKKAKNGLEKVILKDEETGRLIESGYEKKGLPEGEHHWYDANGNIIITLVYEDGKAVGCGRELEDPANGLTVKKGGDTPYDIEYYDSNNKLVKARYYYSNGKPSRFILDVGNGVQEILDFSFDDNFNSVALSATGFVKEDGTKIGRWVDYSSSKVETITYYDDNGNEMEYFDFFDDGEISVHRVKHSDGSFEEESYKLHDYHPLEYRIHSDKDGNETDIDDDLEDLTDYRFNGVKETREYDVRYGKQGTEMSLYKTGFEKADGTKIGDWFKYNLSIVQEFTHYDDNGKCREAFSFYSGYYDLSHHCAVYDDDSYEEESYSFNKGLVDEKVVYKDGHKTKVYSDSFIFHSLENLDDNGEKDGVQIDYVESDTNKYGRVRVVSEYSHGKEISKTEMPVWDN